MGDGHRLVADSFHVGADLLGHFLEDLLSEVAHAHALVKFDELNDVPDTLLVHRVSKPPTVAIELFHGRKICVADAYNDDRAGKLGKFTDYIYGLGHVMDAPVCQEQQYLILVCLECRLDVPHEFGQQRAEQSRTPKSDVRQRLAICLHYIRDSGDVGIAWVPVHGEAVVHRVDTEVARNAPEAEHWEASV